MYYLSMTTTRPTILPPAGSYRCPTVPMLVPVMSCDLLVWAPTAEAVAAVTLATIRPGRRA